MSHSIAGQVSAWGLFSFLISGHRLGRGLLESVFLGRRLGLHSDLRNFQSLSLKRCNMRNLVFNLRLGFVGDCSGISGGIEVRVYFFRVHHRYRLVGPVSGHLGG